MRSRHQFLPESEKTMFDIEKFIIAVYVNIEQRLKPLLGAKPLLRGGFAPTLSDAEVITIEIVGEFLGHHTNSGIWRYVYRHWKSWFPKLPHRTTFLRQAANLWAYKQQPTVFEAIFSLMTLE